MAAVRNIQVKLEVPEETHDVLEETFEQFRGAAQHVADYGWSDEPTEIISDQGDLNAATYDEVREQTDLHSNHVQSARRLAADALKTCQDRIFDGKKTSKPTFRGSVIVYGSRTITYNDDYCTLATVDGRVRAHYVIPEDETGTPFAEYWDRDEWERKEATLHKRDGEFYLHVAVEQELETAASTVENGVVLGVDLNVDGYLAVTSTGRFLGNADYLNHKRAVYERRRGRLQQTGTRSARLTIQSIGDRFARWSDEYLHQVSKAIVQEARRHDCAAIAFEDLASIRTGISNLPKFQQWAFRTIQRFTEYKAEANGISVERVSPAYTSQRCSHTACGFTHEKNRTSNRFECLKCGKELHADYNAARNIGWQLVQHWHMSGAGRANCQVALKSGTLNGNGKFRPAVIDGQTRSPLTSPPH
ncbi:IS200/IS605 family element transposase accessory protein TnpB [Natronomonas salina]|uniref:RNA-guided endonuclease InsQ/TnpB family protein n=1 Tax=Natronomonas salina TaxID=1710540 RepID=UPI0015B40BA8|nr:RNA-guided endonuclease TnpB family protein [Natronomonas salina]QLD90826.1 IS200/IS605 family element transposase accessory protein TnpB [Natronomonas salina]